MSILRLASLSLTTSLWSPVATAEDTPAYDDADDDSCHRLPRRRLCSGSGNGEGGGDADGSHKISPLLLPAPAIESSVAKVSETALNWPDSSTSAFINSANAKINQLVRILRPARHDLELVLGHLKPLLHKMLCARLFACGTSLTLTGIGGPKTPIHLVAFFTASTGSSGGNCVAGAGSTLAQKLREALLVPNSGVGKVRVEQQQEPLLQQKEAGLQTIQVVHAVVLDKYEVCIHCNDASALPRAALLLEIDSKLESRRHLLQKTLLLFRAFCRFDAGLAAEELSDSAIDVIILSLFNSRHRHIHTPAQGLYAVIAMLSELAAHDLVLHPAGCMPRPLSSPSTSATVGNGRTLSMSAMRLSMAKPPPSHSCLLPEHVVEHYRTMLAPIPSPCSTNSAISVLSEPTTTAPDWINDEVVILDPLDLARNMVPNSSMLKEAFRSAGDRLRRAQTLWYHQGASMMSLLEASYSFAVESVLVNGPQEALCDMEVFGVDLEDIRTSALEAAAFGAPNVDEQELVNLLRTVLLEQSQAGSGYCSVGKLGTLVHSRTNAHGLPAFIKARFGGLKKLLERHGDLFVLGTDHPYNPQVFLKSMPILQSISEGDSENIQPTLPNAMLGTSQTSLQNTCFGSSRMSSSGSRRRSRGSRAAGGKKQNISAARRQMGKGNNTQSSAFSSNSGSSYSCASSESSVSQWLRQTLCCPISGFVMVDAVVASDGYTFEKSALEAWTQQNGQISPVTGQRLTGVTLPNRALGNLANLWRHLNSKETSASQSLRNSF